MSERSCDCEVCTDTRRWLEAIDPQTPEAISAVDEILERLADAETSSDYWEMKFDGTWPGDKDNGCMV